MVTLCCVTELTRPMLSTPFLQRVVFRNYKSIASCDVSLGALTYLVGVNGSGKSNFLDVLHLVRDALTGSLGNAINERGGINEVRRRSAGPPTHFGIRLEFALRTGQSGWYAFEVAALSNGAFEVRKEECVLSGIGKGPFFRLERGKSVQSSEPTFPAVSSDRLALVNASGLEVFRPVYDGSDLKGFLTSTLSSSGNCRSRMDGCSSQPERRWQA